MCSDMCSEGTVIYNLGMFTQIPLQLYLSERLPELYNRVLFSYDGLYNKAKALSLASVLADFSLNPGTEATLVEWSLMQAVQ